jgi:GxxExxY protein
MGENDAYVDEEMEPDPELNRITNEIIGAAIEVHRLLGPGQLEIVYERSLAIEFTRRGIPFLRQHPIDVYYKGERVGSGRLDFLVYGKVILDVKAVESYTRTFTAQMIFYLRTTEKKLGLIINFNVGLLKDGIRRIAL